MSKNNFGTVLKALFRNKFRFGTDVSDGKKAAILSLLSIAYLGIVIFVCVISVFMGGIFARNGLAAQFYILLLLSGAVIVLIFGIIFLINTLYISKDSDFFSTLPIKSSVIFGAKLMYVYLCEAALVVIALLPATIVFGIVSGAWVWYYVITLLTLAIIPAFPLIVAAIIAVPLMYIAGKMKNRNIISLIFYCVMFIGLFGVYFYFIFAMGNIDSLDIDIDKLRSTFKILEYVCYPYAVLANAAFGVPQYGLSGGAATAVNLIIFFAVSSALIVLIMLLGRFMYGQSSKSNNQTHNSGKAKKGDYRAAGSVKALIRREYVCAMRTTQTAFQCFVVFAMPILFSILFGFLFGNMFSGLDDMVNTDSVMFNFAVMAIMLSVLGNAAITTFSREGSALASLKSLPVGINTLLKAKILAWFIIAAPVAVVAAVITCLFNFSIINVVFAVITFPTLAFAYIAFGALWDLTSPKLKWTDPVQAVKHNMHATAGQFICMAGGFLGVIISLVCMILPISPTIASTIFWVVILLTAVIFAIVDILLYKKADTFYKRIEI